LHDLDKLEGPLAQEFQPGSTIDALVAFGEFGEFGDIAGAALGKDDAEAEEEGESSNQKSKLPEKRTDDVDEGHNGDKGSSSSGGFSPGRDDPTGDLGSIADINHGGPLPRASPGQASQGTLSQSAFAHLRPG
jgi:hypothetical protein